MYVYFDIVLHLRRRKYNVIITEGIVSLKSIYLQYIDFNENNAFCYYDILFPPSQMQNNIKIHIHKQSFIKPQSKIIFNYSVFSGFAFVLTYLTA